MEIKTDNRGIALILTIIIVTLLLFLGIYILNNALNEEMIAKSQGYGVNSYYLAESGMNHMTWKIINDATFANNFITDPLWFETLTKNDPLGSGSGSYTVTASNKAAGDCDVKSTGQFDIGNGKSSQRVIKTNLFRPTGTVSTPIDDSAGFASFWIQLRNININFLNGSAHCNGNFLANNTGINMYIDGDLRAGGKYNEHTSAVVAWGATSEIYADNWSDYAPRGVGPADSIPMPSVDFDIDPANSLKALAEAESLVTGLKCDYTQTEFSDYLWDALDLNSGISQLPDCKYIYVDGDVELKGGIELRSPVSGGMLAIGDDLTVGKFSYWKKGGTTYSYDSGYNDIIFTYIAGQPSGIFVKDKIDFLQYTGEISFEGIIYSVNTFEIRNLSYHDFYVRGATVGYWLNIDSCPLINMTIEHDPDIINDTLDYTPEAPTLSINHWEEEY